MIAVGSTAATKSEVIGSHILRGSVGTCGETTYCFTYKRLVNFETLYDCRREMHISNINNLEVSL